MKTAAIIFVLLQAALIAARVIGLLQCPWTWAFFPIITLLTVGVLLFFTALLVGVWLLFRGEKAHRMKEGGGHE